MIICFYTPRYAEEAEGLRRSAAALEYPIELIPISESGSWAANCAKKAEVCRDALTGHEQILFLDADARIKGNIDQLLRPHDGIRLHIVKPEQFRAGWFAQRYRYHALRHGGMWNSGVMSIRRSPEVMALMDAWVDMCAKCPGEWDQLCLQWAHIKSGSTVPVVDIPSQYRAGGPIIGHKSAFHAKWKTAQDKPLRKVLLLGSAAYLTEWWEQHRDAYVNSGFAIVAMNNACQVVGDDCHLWLVPNDYSGSHSAAEYIPTNKGGIAGATNKARNWVDRPYWSHCPTTIMTSSVCHLLNEAVRDGCQIEVHLAGCDMVYSGDKTHFYGNGGKDPLRYQPRDLQRAQDEIQQAYSRHGCKIFNAGGQTETRLVFDKCRLPAS